jgi:transcriptional regulator with XRE-family HTH domain
MSNVLQAHRELVGRRIRVARRAKLFSHDTLAARVGTTRQHLIRLEKGAHMPRPAMLARIAEATDRDTDWFESDDDEESDPVSDLYAAVRRVVRAEMKSATPTIDATVLR